MLSEEEVDDRRRLTSARVWIVDPLDGTREFGEEGRDDWAVHVALWENGGLIAGAVALPEQGVVRSTAEPAEVPPARPSPGPLRIAVSRTRRSDFVKKVCELLGAESVAMGSAGAKAMAVLDGTVDAYVHTGGQYEWDSAAPVAVAHASGLHTSRVDGSPLRYNRPYPLLPDLLICRAEIAEEILHACLHAGQL